MQKKAENILWDGRFRENNVGCLISEELYKKTGNTFYKRDIRFRKAVQKLITSIRPS